MMTSFTVKACRVCSLNGLVYRWCWLLTTDCHPILKVYRGKLKQAPGEVTVTEDVDPFVLADSRVKSNDTTPNNQHFPPVKAADLVSYLVLESSFVTAHHFKASK